MKNLAAAVVITMTAAAIVGLWLGGQDSASAHSHSVAFEPSPVVLAEVGDSVTIDVVVSGLEVDAANTVQVGIIHDDAVVEIRNPQCGDLYSGESSTAAARVLSDTATVFACSLKNGPTGTSGTVMTFVIERVGNGDPLLQVIQDGNFRTTFYEAGTEVKPTSVGSLQVALPTPTPTATPTSGGGGGGGGSSLPAPTPIPTPLPTAPGVPVNVTAEPGDGQATVNWSAPPDGGSPITSYSVIVLPGGETTTVPPTVLRRAITGLDNGVTYQFQVFATNAIGVGEASSPTAPVTPAGVPGAPTGVSAALGADGRSAIVTWNPPASDGGRPLTGFNVIADPIDLAPQDVDADADSATFNDLSIGTTYVFRVRAVNEVGQGSESAASNSITPGLLPTPTPTPASETEPQQTLIDTNIGGEQAELDALQEALNAAAGSGIQVSQDPVTVTTQQGRIVTSIPLEGMTPGSAITGSLGASIGKLTFETADGAGTAQIDLGDGLHVKGAARLVVTDQGLDIEIDEPVLAYNPSPPPSGTLAGGSSSVTDIGVEFQVGVNNLPSGGGLSITYSKTAGSEGGSGAAFQLAAKSAGGVISDPTEDVAFVVNVIRNGIESDDLGSNTTVMRVSRAWYETKLAEGKAIAITKVGDDGVAHTAQAECGVSGDMAKCTATFTGAAGGFSAFGLVAMLMSPPAAATPDNPPQATMTPPAVGGLTPTATPLPEIEPTPTALPGTPVPSATAGPTATPDAEIPGEPESASSVAWWVWIVGAVVGVALARGAVAMIALARKKEGGS